MQTALYIPGLGHEASNLSVKDYARRMMKAIDENVEDPQKTYKIESGEREYDKDGNIANVTSIIEIQDGTANEIYRLYEFNYSKFLTARYDESHLLYKFFSIFVVLLIKFKSVIQSLLTFKDEIKAKNKFQALYFLVLYVIFALYLIFLVPSILALFSDFASNVQQLDFLVTRIDKYQNAFNVLLASFSAFMLLSPDTRTAFSEMATEYLAANQYLSIGEQRSLILGKLTRLIEVITEEATESEIEIHGYSFGSVLALDLLFPYDTEANTRVKNYVTKLITIGCPFDFIEIYWKNYFSDRKLSQLSLKSWININSDLDVLSTNFSKSPHKQKRFINSESFWEHFNAVDVTYNVINPDRVSFIQLILLYGLRAHRWYWDKYIDSKSCLSIVVRQTRQV